MSRVGHVTSHHPLCPSCGYDLVAAANDHKIVCPECGSDFEPHELKRRRPSGEWTAWRGLGRATGVLVLRAIPCLIGWAALLWGVTVPAAWLAAGRHGRVVMVIYIVAMLLLAGCATVIGRVMAKNMDEHAGMTSIIVAAMIAAFACLAFVGGTLIVYAVSPLSTNAAWGTTIVACGFSLLVIIKIHFFEDY